MNKHCQRYHHDHCYRAYHQILGLNQTWPWSNSFQDGKITIGEKCGLNFLSFITGMMWLGDLGLAIWVTVIINIINFIVNIVTMLIVTPWKPLEIFLVIFTFCLGIRGCVWSLQRVVLRGWRWPELLRLHLLHVRLRPPHPPLGKHWELLRMFDFGNNWIFQLIMPFAICCGCMKLMCKGCPKGDQAS